ncbi:O-antigen/teichoic acid export membrane protein [Microbacterium sp. SLBN-154]|uniref:lipopolysaccharide biosynthesis protein n=1 Tax=Microbacterium sp. SLBN-154 TaxID=2768458 RepID=UPI0011515AED|nr:hypothetical protein [Microbacterium sp. SLBN-154]TQK18709.1 O-antigen/teichoic acid export membrane protein [Microbacterium sp. SLBN-154]
MIATHRTITERRGIAALIAREWADPALRGSHLMLVNTAVTAALGFAFWVVAARLLPVEAVGTGTATVAIVLTIAGLGQLNLYQSAGVLLARASGDGRAAAFRLWALAAGATLAVGAVVSAIVVTMDVLAVRTAIVPQTLPLLVTCAVAWTAFAVKDALLIARRRTALVPALNSGYAVLKIAALVGAVALLPATARPGEVPGGDAIVLATFAPIALVVPVAALVIALPRIAPPREPAVAVGTRRGDDARFLAADYIGVVALQSCTTLLPFIVFAWAGAEMAGVFAAAWAIVLVLDTLAHNAAVPLATELARTPERREELSHRVTARTLVVVAVGAAVLAIFAEPILALLGPTYAAQGAPVLQVFAAASILRAILILRLAGLRAARRTGRIALVEVTHAAAVLGIAAWAVPNGGALGMALAWAAGQVVALAVVIPLSGGRRGSTRAVTHGP